MTSRRLMRAFVIASTIVMLAIVARSLKNIPLLPPSATLSEYFYYLRLDQLAFAVIFTLYSFQTKKQWEAGSIRGLFLFQVYMLVLVMYTVDHWQMFRASASYVDLFMALLLGAVALLGMITYYIKNRESQRKE